MKTKERFETLKTYQVIELHILVMLFFTTLYIYKDQLIFDQFNITDHSGKEQAVLSSKNYITKNSNNSLSQMVYEKGKEYKIQIRSLKFKNDLLILDIHGDFENCINFLNELGVHIKLKNLKIKKEAAAIYMQAAYSKRYFFNEKSTYKKIAHIPNPFNHNTKKSTEEDYIIFNLKAIIRDFVNINGCWHKKGNILNSHKILEISPNMVKMINIKTKDTKELYLFKE